MGREIRMVPPNWKHPQTEKYGQLRDQPMYNETFDKRFSEWLADFDRIRMGAMTDLERECYPQGLREWLVDEGVPPDPAYYRPWKDEEATWVQVWETVSEGCPVSPPFATKAELVDYLAANGDFWDQKRGDGPWDRAAAEKFVEAGWAPSMIIHGGQAFTARDEGMFAS